MRALATDFGHVSEALGKQFADGKKLLAQSLIGYILVIPAVTCAC